MSTLLGTYELCESVPALNPAQLRRASDERGRRRSERVAAAEALLRLHGEAGRPGRRFAHACRLAWLRHAPAACDRFARLGKRGQDVAVAALALLALTPLFAVVAFLVRRTDGGPVLFWQVRTGRQGTPFAMPKFRSMRVDADRLKDELLAKNDHGAGVTFKMKLDPRVTPIGRVIRRFSIDELPQLWCVLKGDMSLVGPRPAVPREVALYTLSDRRRLDVKPGLTCLWQVGGRGDLPFDRQVALDVEYVETQSLWLDLWLLLKTIPAVVSGRGAY